VRLGRRHSFAAIGATLAPSDPERTMTPQEKAQIEALMDRLDRMGPAPKDPEAEALIRARLARLPGIEYVLVQGILINEAALIAAKDQVAQLERQVQSHPPAAAAAPPVPPSVPPSVPPPLPPQMPPVPPAAPASVPAAGQSFWGSAARTAAGVAGGILAAEAVSSLFHHASPFTSTFGGASPLGNSAMGGGFMGGSPWGGGPAVIENTTIINEAAPAGRDDAPDDTSDDHDGDGDDGRYAEAVTDDDDGGWDDDGGDSGFDDA